MQQNMTKGSIAGNLFRFAGPFLVSSFLQTFYGLADLFITGQFNGAASISGVAIGSQVMHMLTVVIVGLSVGPTVLIARAVGAKKKEMLQRLVGNSICLFSVFAAVMTVLLLLLKSPIMQALSTPSEAVGETAAYMVICFLGIPFITAYNVASAIFRGLGDTKSPMKYVAAAGVINVGLDLLLIGPAGMGAAGAALATVLSQAISDILAVRALFRMKDIVPARRDIHFDRDIFPDILRIGVPVALQEGFIQISFLAITAIANGRGLEVSAAVGVVEKIISFLFLVPSAMLSTVSAVAAQNAGAGQHERSRQALFTSILFCCIYGACVFVLCQFVSEQLVSLFLHDDPVAVTLGGQYLRSYSLDTLFAGIQFCFSGFFSAYGKAFYSFIHNLISILLVRIPGAALASRYFPDTLYPMGLAAPLGSLLSSVICVFLYIRGRRFWIPAAQEQEEHRSSSF